MFTSKSFKAEFRIAVLLVALLVGFGSSAVTVSAAPNVLEGITLDASLSPQDIVYLESSLNLLYTQAPDWFLYIEQAKPFTLIVDLHQGELGREAITSCCDLQERGTIVFGHPLGYSFDAKSPEAQQVMFIGTLVHEITHLREQRTGQISAKVDFKSCVAAEKPGLEKQYEVKRALYAGNMGANYKQAIEQQIAQETAELKSRALWDFYCGAFE